MKIIINPKQKTEDMIKNIVFLKAIIIKEYIESKNISYDQKQEMRRQVLDYLQKN